MARAETEVLMLGSNNILGPKDGKPIVTPGQDLVLGNFYLNMEETAEEFYAKADALEALGEKREAARWRRYGDNEGHIFKDVNEVLMGYQTGVVHLHSRVALPAKALNKTSFTDKQQEQYLLTSVGKIIFNEALPSDFPYLNEVTSETLVATPDSEFVPYGTNIKEELANRPVTTEFKKDNLGNLIAAVFEKYKAAGGTSDILDSLKDMGYLYSTLAGMTVSLSDISVAPHKEEIVGEGREKADKLNELRDRGLLTGPEWEKSFSALWNDVKENVGNALMSSLPRMNPINMMAVSGARGSKNHFTQLAGMRGLMSRPTQTKSRKEFQPSIIEVPIYSCFREGMSVSEFFISTHGVRKGLTDTALKTAESGYLTRRLVDVAQEVIITEEDCGTERGYPVRDIVDNKNNAMIEKFFDRIVGRYSQQPIVHPKTGEVIVDENTYITEALAKEVVNAGIEEARIRNVFTCDCKTGICVKCYGRNMATGNIVEVGEAVGIMAAQAIGEPGTQLTMRNFHTGGVATQSGDITQGLPRVQELFEARTPKGVAVISKIDGKITDIRENDTKTGTIITVSNDNDVIEHKCDLTQVKRQWLDVGSEVKAGEKLTEGQIAPKELLAVAGVRKCQEYILKEVKKVYEAQKIGITDKHLEIVIKQMLKQVIVIEGNDTGLASGQTLSLTRMNDINDKIIDEDKVPAKFEPILLGISKSAVETDSFLSAASFQETTRVLTDASVRSKVDHLEGLKENVIIGKLIPAGTGRDFDRETSRIIRERADELERTREEKEEILKELERTRNGLPEEVLGRERERESVEVPADTTSTTAE